MADCIRSVPLEEANFLWREAYNHYVRTVIEPGEQLPYSQHLKAIDAAILKLSTIMIDLSEVATNDHPDDLSVDRFAAAMKAKLAAKRAEGYGGWDDPEQCRVESLSRKLREHVEKGDPVDVANFAMMLHQRGSAILPPDELSEAGSPTSPPVGEDTRAARGATDRSADVGEG